MKFRSEEQPCKQSQTLAPICPLHGGLPQLSFVWLWLCLTSDFGVVTPLFFGVSFKRRKVNKTNWEHPEQIMSLLAEPAAERLARRWWVHVIRNRDSHRQNFRTAHSRIALHQTQMAWLFSGLFSFFLHALFISSSVIRLLLQGVFDFNLFGMSLETKNNKLKRKKHVRRNHAYWNRMLLQPETWQFHPHLQLNL